jgi:hypothetical protein
MDMFNSIEDIKRANKHAGHHWFDQGAMDFFDTIIYDRLIQHPEGAYFVTSEKQDSFYPRLFTVRFARLTGEVNTVGEFQGFSDTDTAYAWAEGHRDARQP